MDPAFINIIVSALSGAVGGNIAGSAIKGISLGTLWNSVAGIVGGGLGGKILAILVPALGAAISNSAGGLDIMAIIGQVLGGGVGGGVLMAVIGAIRSAMAK